MTKPVMTKRRLLQPFAIAASTLLAVAAPVLGSWGLSGRAVNNFNRDNSTAIEIKFNGASGINLADAYGANPIVQPQSIHLPQGVYKMVRAGLNIQDPDRLAWEADRTVLRKTNGVSDSGQKIFEYLVVGEGKIERITVTPSNLQATMDRLELALK